MLLHHPDKGNDPSRDKLMLALSGFEALLPKCADSPAENALQDQELRKKIAAPFLADFCSENTSLWKWIMAVSHFDIIIDMHSYDGKNRRMPPGMCTSNFWMN